MNGLMDGTGTSTAAEVRRARQCLGDILVAHVLRVHHSWLDAIGEGEPDGGVRGRLDALSEAIEMAGPDEWLLRAWIIGAEPGEMPPPLTAASLDRQPPAELLRAGELGAFRANARLNLDDPAPVMTKPLADAKAALEGIERSGLTGLSWLEPHLDALRALVAEHEQLLRERASAG